jgi:hypothetical protein
LQRFISEDPIGFAGGDPNLYAYARNNPATYSDPLGLCRAPSGPGISYCIQTFIPTPYAWGFTGDNRGPEPHFGTFRTHQEIFQLSNGATTSSSEPGISQLGPLRRRAVPGMCSASVIPLPLGGRKIHATCRASDGLLFGQAPDAFYDFIIRENAQGEATVVSAYGTVFPSIEIWQYGRPGGPVPVYHYPTTAGPGDLLQGVVPLR